MDPCTNECCATKARMSTCYYTEPTLIPAACTVPPHNTSEYDEALSLRLLQLAAGPATLEEAPAAGAWLQHFVQFMVAGTELAEQLHKAHTQYGKILVRRILCALWNKQLDERR